MIAGYFQRGNAATNGTLFGSTLGTNGERDMETRKFCRAMTNRGHDAATALLIRRPRKRKEVFDLEEM